jgi:serine protease AprX
VAKARKTGAADKPKNSRNAGATDAPTAGDPVGRPSASATGAPSEPKRYSREDLRQDLLRGLITEPLLTRILQSRESPFDIIISLNELFPEGLDKAAAWVEGALQALDPKPERMTRAANYVFARLTGTQILELAAEYRKWVTSLADRFKSPVYRVWEDADIHPCLTHSLSTIKGDACHRAFNSFGEGIVWGVLDSGIDKDHPHFAPDVVDVTLSQTFVGGSATEDKFGHGTHVGGIIAGGWKADPKQAVVATEMLIEGTDQTEIKLEEIGTISGIAPKCRLVSYKVLDDSGVGKTSAVLTAIEEIQKLNQHGRRLRIHGVNLSLGYDFNPRWFGCGQSPLCVEVDRLVRSGVVVVVAAGNSGFSGLGLTAQNTTELGYRDVSINDPGNAALAITVGSTHREMPHTYGVSFFSSRGPTGDGRLKPDLVAPGERIVSCAAGSFLERMRGKVPAGAHILYLEQSGTSMAAPHVSGAIAAFLSVRQEFIGHPEKVKDLFLANTIDLKRERAFQGYGMLDLLKVLQAV